MMALTFTEGRMVNIHINITVTCGVGAVSILLIAARALGWLPF